MEIGAALWVLWLGNHFALPCFTTTTATAAATAAAADDDDKLIL